MTATDDPAGPAPASPDEPMEAQFGPHRFHAGEGGGEQFRGARFDVADLRGARFTGCDLIRGRRPGRAGSPLATQARNTKSADRDESGIRGLP
jgi:hypothetical protein